MIRSAAQSSILNDTKYTSMSAGVVPSNEYLINTTTLPSNTPSVTFDVSSFSGIYRHLQIVAAVRAQRDTFQNTYFHLRFNNDESASYANHFLINLSSSVSSFGSGSQNGMGLAWIPTQNAATNNFGAAVIDILDPFSSSKNKTIRTLGGSSGTDEPRISLSSGAYFSTNPVSSITIFSTTGNLIAGSRFSLYGVTA
jgi:hypothetical protein